MTLCKICGITDGETAYQSAILGADFIGLVFVPSSKRALDLHQAKAVGYAAKKGGAKVVGVFTDQSVSLVTRNAQECGLDLIQVYSKRLYDKISQKYPCIFALRPGQNHFPANCDYLLYDSAAPGGGLTWEFAQMKRPVNIPFFIAGGLNPTNVHDVLRTCKPHGVDVSSGVEDSKSGKKDLFLIREFIDIVKRGKNDN